jgi:hypothetical protein
MQCLICSSKGTLLHDVTQSQIPIKSLLLFVCNICTARLDFSNLLLILDGVQKQVFAHLCASGETKMRLLRR